MGLSSLLGSGAREREIQAWAGFPGSCGLEELEELTGKVGEGQLFGALL